MLADKTVFYEEVPQRCACGLGNMQEKDGIFIIHWILIVYGLTDKMVGIANISGCGDVSSKAICKH